MILAFIKEIEKDISDSTIILSSTIQKHFSPSRKEAYLTGNLLFIDISSLEFAVYITEKGRKTSHKHRLQYMNSQNRQDTTTRLIIERFQPSQIINTCMTAKS